jgi:hypothetical protein
LNADGSHPEIAFITASGEQIAYPQGGFIFGYQKTSQCGCAICPSNPPAAPLSMAGRLRGTPVLLGCIGLVFTLVGLLEATGKRGRAAHSLKGL